MCSGFATVSGLFVCLFVSIHLIFFFFFKPLHFYSENCLGSVMAAYIRFGADPAHLLTASVMSAPAALCYSKLFYPETEKSETKSDNIPLEKT